MLPPLYPLEDETSVLRVVQTVDHIEQRRLPSPVGTNDGQELTGVNIHADITQRLHGSKGQGDMLRLQYRDAASARYDVRLRCLCHNRITLAPLPSVSLHRRSGRAALP